MNPIKNINELGGCLVVIDAVEIRPTCFGNLIRLTRLIWMLIIFPSDKISNLSDGQLLILPNMNQHVLL